MSTALRFIKSGKGWAAKARRRNAKDNLRSENGIELKEEPNQTALFTEAGCGPRLEGRSGDVLSAGVRNAAVRPGITEAQLRTAPGKQLHIKQGKKTNKKKNARAQHRGTYKGKVLHLTIETVG